MKTTIEISGPILSQARRLAALEGTTVKALIEQGLCRIIADSRKSETFHLRQASFKGNGLHHELRNAPWSRLRALAYKKAAGNAPRCQCADRR